MFRTLRKLLKIRYLDGVLFAEQCHQAGCLQAILHEYSGFESNFTNGVLDYAKNRNRQAEVGC